MISVLEPIELDQYQPVHCPLYTTAVQAGFPSPADDHLEGNLDLNEYLVKRPSSTFFVRVSGDSMIGAGIMDNDVLVVDKSIEAKHGHIVIAIIDSELTVKRLINRGANFELHPENPNYPIIRFNPGETLQIWGVVTGVTRKF